MSDASNGSVDVLVVGAGPTGLALALQASDHGARVRVVERRAERFRPSRALIVHPRTLEVLRPLGVTDDLLGRGEVSPSIQLHLGATTIDVQLGRFDIEDTAFPYLLFEKQADVESVLSEALERRGVEIERGVELVGLDVGFDRTDVRLRREEGDERVGCRYVAGCDGASSAVRALAGIGWIGAGYRQEVVLADLELDGDLEPGVAHAVAGRRGVLFMFSAGERATWRMLATRPRDAARCGPGQPSDEVSTRELRRLLDDAGIPARVAYVAWSSRVPLQHRLASIFRRGRLFVVGDAAHVHSPAGGQGMNLGIQDATNLGWKLALAARGEATPTAADRLLDSYERERRPVARRVLAMTHVLFWAEAGVDPVVSLVRGKLVPLAAPFASFALHRRRLVAEGVRVLSQLRGNYRHSALSVEGTPVSGREPRRCGDGTRPGSRVPDSLVGVDGRLRRLHQVLARPGVHVLLHAGATAPHESTHSPLVHVHRIANWPGAGIVVVRPDGYVGLRCTSEASGALAEWLALLGFAATPRVNQLQGLGPLA